MPPRSKERRTILGSVRGFRIVPFQKFVLVHNYYDFKIKTICQASDLASFRTVLLYIDYQYLAEFKRLPTETSGSLWTRLPGTHVRRLREVSRRDFGKSPQMSSRKVLNVKLFYYIQFNIFICKWIFPNIIPQLFLIGCKGQRQSYIILLITTK